MAGLNRVCLIGIAVRPPTVRDGRMRLVVGVPEADGRPFQRVDVTVHNALVAMVDDIVTAQVVYVEGLLGRLPDGRPTVEAVAFFALGDRPPPPIQGAAIGTTHASPRPHTRAGHPRRIHTGTPRERVVWVRPCRVGRVAITP